MQHQWLQMSQNNPHDDDDDVTYMKEFICFRCRQSLKQRKPKMPDQACANGLKLDDSTMTINTRKVTYLSDFPS